MARQESFTYGTLVVGGASATYPSEIKDRFGISETIDAEGNAFAEFVCQFVVTGTTATLPTNCKAVEAALNLYRQKLLMDFGATNQIVYNPAVNSGQTLGFDAAPSLRKLEDATSTGLSRGYEFRVRIMLPVLLSGQDYRRTSLTTLNYNVSDRQTVVVSGNYTASPNLAARATMLTYIDGFIDARIVALFGGPPTTEWALLSKDEPTNDPNTVASFSRVYGEHVGGRRAETYDVATGPAGIRAVAIRGTYIRTPGAPLSTTAAAATANYLANQPAESAAVLALLPVPLYTSGSGSNAELINSFYSPNEQDDRLEFIENYQELIVKQSPEASGLNDPEIISDTMIFSRSLEPANDSPVPNGSSGSNLNLGPPPDGAARSPGLTVSGAGGSGGGGGGGSSGAGSGGTSVRKWVTLAVSYNATIQKDLNLRVKWDRVILPYLIRLMAGNLGLAPFFIMDIRPAFNETASTITAEIVARGVEGDLYAFQMNEATDSDFGVRLDPAFTGEPHNYLVQQALPRSNRVRSMRAMSNAAGSFRLANLASGSSIPGWVLVRRTVPTSTYRVVGASNDQIQQFKILDESMDEHFVYVAANVAGSFGAAPTGNSPSPSGGSTGGGGPGGGLQGSPGTTGSTGTTMSTELVPINSPEGRRARALLIGGSPPF